MKTLKVLSALLTYPSGELITAAPELKAILAREAVVPRSRRAAVEALIDDIAGRAVGEREPAQVSGASAAKPADGALVL